MDYDKLADLIKLFEDSKLQQMGLETKEFSLKLSKIDASIFSTNDDKVARKSEMVSKAKIIKSPLVGTLYLQASPKEAPYVSVGDEIKVGQTLCLIETMKIMNEVKAEISGVLESVMVEDGQVVEYDSPLFLIRPETNLQSTG